MLSVLIKAVTFDLWNTLLEEKDYWPDRARYLQQMLKCINQPRTEEVIKEAYNKVQEYIRMIDQTEDHRFVPIEDRIELFIRNLSLELSPELKWAVKKHLTEVAAKNPPPLVKDAGDVLRILRNKYRLGIISDSGLTPGSILRKVLEDHGILPLLDVTVFSDEVGYNKPHKAMFDKALNNLQVRPDEAVHVGDLLHKDIVGARKAGMKAIWYNPKREKNLSEVEFDFEVHRLIDVVRAIEELSQRSY
ncbi:MAG: HAD family hydrolase [Nitrososphaerota archaeon]|nr:HAD family hydrolase [Candidatus Bathyarchaeota archaeon]MDW8048421.1 HAD family hydrolase [Nitrososphaerota archaeon]